MIGRLALLVAGTALFVAATGSASSTAEARKGGTLRLGTFQDVYFIDPALAYTAWSAPVTFATCAKLFNHPDEPGAAGTRVIPEVVERHAVSKDGRVYTFDLKRTFRFHTGAAVTARSFADAFTRDADPRLRSPATSFMHEIEGADAVIDGKARSISGIRVLGRYRLQIRLTRPLGDFTARLTLPFFCPVLPNTPIDPNGIDNPAGSGPYYVADWVVNQRIVLERNPYYRGNRPANVDRVVWAIGDTPEACLRAVEENRLDHCVHFGVSPAAFRELAEKYGVNRPGGQLFVVPVANTWYLAFNHERPAFRGPGQIPLKKAINYAIDRLALLRRLPGGQADRSDPPTRAGACGEHLSTRGAGSHRCQALVRSGPPEADDARLLLDQRAIVCCSGAGARVRPEAAGHRARGEVLRSRDVAREDLDPGRAVRHREERVGGRLRRRRIVLLPAPRRQEHPAHRQSQRRLLRRSAD
jgi:peptide/nickel transport system substrate-binding protein